MDFSDALRACKSGEKIQRSGWNGKNMWVKIQVPDENSKMNLPYFYMRTVSGALVPWLASQSDLLTDDWNVLSDNKIVFKENASVKCATIAIN
jgi:hypothetical protein